MELVWRATAGSHPVASQSLRGGGRTRSAEKKRELKLAPHFFLMGAGIVWLPNAAGVLPVRPMRSEILTGDAQLAHHGVQSSAVQPEPCGGGCDHATRFAQHVHDVLTLDIFQSGVGRLRVGRILR